MTSWSCTRTSWRFLALGCSEIQFHRYSESHTVDTKFSQTADKKVIVNRNFIQSNMKMQCTKILLISIIVLMLSNHTYARAAPGSVFTCSSRSEDQQSFSPWSYVASKAMGALVKCASLACQWLPIPDFIKPAKPTLRIVEPSNHCVRDMDWSLADFD